MSLYKLSCIATSILFVFLFFQLISGAESFVRNMGLLPSEASSIIARRAAVFMLGISVLLFPARNLTHSDARQFICISIGTVMTGLACMGVYEYTMETVNNSIFVAISIESILALLFLIVFIRDRIHSNIRATPVESESFEI